MELRMSGIVLILLIVDTLVTIDSEIIIYIRC